MPDDKRAPEASPRAPNESAPTEEPDERDLDPSPLAPVEDDVEDIDEDSDDEADGDDDDDETDDDEDDEQVKSEVARAPRTLPGSEMRGHEHERLLKHLEETRGVHQRHRVLWGSIAAITILAGVFFWIMTGVSDQITGFGGFLSGLIACIVGGFFGWMLRTESKQIQSLELDARLKRKHVLEGIVKYKDEKPIADGMRYFLTLNEMRFETEWKDFNKVRFNDQARFHVGAQSRFLLGVQSLNKRPKRKNKKSPGR